MFLRRSLAAAALVTLLACSAAWPAERLPGPFRATVERVVDGDTLAVRVPIWIGQELAVLVRIRGVDAPERRGHCAAERRMAAAATARLAALVAAGGVTLTEVGGGKYFGRVLAAVATPDGRDVAAELIASGLVRPYGGERRRSWCGAAAAARR